MLTVNHVPVGAAIGLALSRHPALALGAGVASHLALDAIPHWGIGEPGHYDEFLHVAKRDGVAALALATLLLAAAPPRARLALIAGVTGAVAPDFDHVATYFIGRTIWPTKFKRFHASIQREGATPMRRELTRAAISSTAVLALLALTS